MAKKKKDDAPSPNNINIPNRDIIQRLNFLYQASSYLNAVGATHSASSQRTDQASEHTSYTRLEKGKWKEGTSPGKPVHSKGSGNMRKWSGRRKATTHDLAQSYVKSMKIIGQKTNVKLDPSVKRSMCKGCNTLLMPGVTAKVRVKPLPSHGHAVQYTCNRCSFSRRIPAPPTLKHNSELHLTQPSAGTTESIRQMDIDPVNDFMNTVKTDLATQPVEDVKQLERRNQKVKKKPIKARPLPFFARSEHTIFIGNECIDENLMGRGTEDKHGQN